MTTKTVGRGVSLTAPKPLEMTLDEYIKGRFKIERSELSTRTASLVSRLENYIAKMQPNQAKQVTDIVALQKSLLDTMLGILSGSLQESSQGWDILLFLALKESNTIFNDRTINQHYDKLPVARQMIFTRLTTLVVGSADVRVRKQFLRSFMLERVLLDLPEEVQKTNLSAFYAGSV